MWFKFEGHDAAGREQTGRVQAKTIEEAAGIIRVKNKIYARKIEPDVEAQAAEPDTKAEALRQVRAQADKCDNMGQDSKAYIYNPGDRDQASPGDVGNPFARTASAPPAKRTCGTPVPPPEEMAGDCDAGAGWGGGEADCSVAKETGWKDNLRHDLSTIDVIIGELNDNEAGEVPFRGLDSDVVKKLRMELVKQAVTKAFDRASGS